WRTSRPARWPRLDSVVAARTGLLARAIQSPYVETGTGSRLSGGDGDAAPGLIVDARHAGFLAEYGSKHRRHLCGTDTSMAPKRLWHRFPTGDRRDTSCVACRRTNARDNSSRAQGYSKGFRSSADAGPQKGLASGSNLDEDAR